MSENTNGETDGDRLKLKFSTIKSERGMSKVEFARAFKVPGGASMISQHISGHRPISLEAAAAYAAGFNCSVAEISPCLGALLLQYKAHPQEAESNPPTPVATPIQSTAARFEEALRIVAVALDQADQSDRNAAKAYLVELCDRPGEVDTFAAKLTRLLTPLPLQANGKQH